MTSLMLVLYSVLGLGVAWGLIHLIRFLRASLPLRGRRWVMRSGRDRRRVFVPVPFDRRKRARRQDDQAMDFLRQIGR